LQEPVGDSGKERKAKFLEASACSGWSAMPGRGSCGKLVLEVFLTLIVKREENPHDAQVF